MAKQYGSNKAKDRQPFQIFAYVTTKIERSIYSNRTFSILVIIIIINCFSVQQNSYELKTNETVTTSEVLTVCQQLAYS